MNIKTLPLAIIILVCFIAGIAGTMITGVWNTESRKQPAVYTSGEAAGMANPADIRGSYSFGDIEKAFGVSADELGRAFGVSGNPSSFTCKELETLYGEQENGEIGTDSVRLYVALALGLPYTPHETTLLPETAVTTLGDRISDDLRAQMERIRSGE